MVICRRIPRPSMMNNPLKITVESFALNPSSTSMHGQHLVRKHRNLWKFDV